MVRKWIIALGLGLMLALGAGANTLAAGSPHTGLSCEEGGVTPGHASSAPGSAFNPGGNAGSRYSENSQYDVACFRGSGTP